MSFKVLVIPEDPTNDRYILVPLAKALLADAGRPAAKVTALTNPRLRGFQAARKAIREELRLGTDTSISGCSFRMPMWSGQGVVPQLENGVAEKKIRMLCCAAEPEVEIFTCAPFRDELGAPWDEVRAHSRLKEEVFEPLRKRHGDDRRAGGGRKAMIDASLRNLPLLYRLCPELKRLRERIEKVIAERDTNLRHAAARLREEAARDVEQLRSRGWTQADFARALRDTLGSGEDGPL